MHHGKTREQCSGKCFTTQRVISVEAAGTSVVVFPSINLVVAAAAGGGSKHRHL
jgi:hypothetical protein